MKRISNKLFWAVLLIGFMAVTGIGTKAVGDVDAVPQKNQAPLENSGSDSVVSDTQLAVTTTSLPAGAAGVVYSQELQASGGIIPYTWSISFGSLPTGLTVIDTGLICGTPVITGTSKFRVQVTDSQNPAVTVKKTLFIAINPPTLAISTASLPDGTARENYNQRLQANGGFFPYKWSVSAGKLPAGLSLKAVTGEISGRPTTAGISKFTVQVTDSQNPAVSVVTNLSIKIEPTVLPNMWFSPR